jgi:transposase
MKKAYEAGDYSMQQIAEAFGVHHFTSNRALRKTSLKNACLQDLLTPPYAASPQHHNKGHL